MQNLGVSQDPNTTRYLGLPSLIGHNKKTVFSYLKSRLWQRIHGWRHKFLSRARKGVLIQSVGQALPSYVMSSFLLPTSLADELQRMLNSFWWGSKKDGRRSLHWLSWDRLCVGKDDGGLGFWNLHWFSLAMLGRHGWRFLIDPDVLVSWVFKAKYFPRGEVFRS